MLALTLPTSAADDDARLVDICMDPGFAVYFSAWQKSYKRYRRKRGNEFAIDAITVDKVTHARQVDLYKNRKDNATFTAVRRTVLVCCPMCGSPGTGALDHHLPESRFGEFAIMIANLVPSCGHCNSGAKHVAGVGAAWPDRFLHPYYDRFAKKALWRVRVTDPVAPRFVPEPEPTLRPRLTKLVAYNLAGLLAWQFEMHLECYWTKIPVLLQTAVGTGVLASVRELDALFNAQYTAVTVTEGLNGWKAAFLRGIRYDPLVRLHIATTAAALPDPV